MALLLFVESFNCPSLLFVSPEFRRRSSSESTEGNVHSILNNSFVGISSERESDKFHLHLKDDLTSS